MELIEQEDLPPRAKGRGGSRLDIDGTVTTLRSRPGKWFKVGREYSGYPSALIKRFKDAGAEVETRATKNDAGVTVGHFVYVRVGANGPTSDDTATE